MSTQESERYSEGDTNPLEIRRQLFHLTAIFLWLFPIYSFPEHVVILLFLTVTILNLLVVLKKQPFYGLFRPFLKSLERTKNMDKPGVQALYANLGIFIAFVLFGDSSAVGVLTLAVGDSFSTLVGRFFGRSKLPWNGEKTWEGCLAFFFTVYIVLSMLVDVGSAVLIAFACSIVESLKLGVDDNLILPPLATALLYLV